MLIVLDIRTGDQYWATLLHPVSLDAKGASHVCS